MPAFDINEALGTSSVALYDGGSVPLTQFSYANGLVTVTARAVVTVSLAQLRAYLDTLDQWASMVKDALSPQTGVLDEFDLDVKSKNGNTTATYKIGNTRLTKAEYDWNTRLIAFDARPEVVIGWCDCLRWFAFLRTFYRDCAGG